MEISTASAFLLGVLGTAHCLGMCGPLVVFLPGSYGRWQAHLLYHAGRLTTYTLVGAGLGAIGAGLGHLTGLNDNAAMQWTARLQVGISLLAAMFLIVFGLVRIGLMREPRWMAGLNPQKLPGYHSALSKIKKRRSSLWLYFMGSILGLLPCGLSYAAFARALATHSILGGAWISLVFGLGTLPGLLILGTGLTTIWRRFRTHMEMASGLLMIAMAASLTADAWNVYF